MGFKRVIARNAVWSGAGMASGMIAGFITAPFLVNHLGDSTYGLWILIASMTSYFNLIDLGLRSSITRHVAFFRTRGDQASVNAILSTAQAILAAAAVITVLATLILLALFTRFGEVPAEQLASARLALVLSGLTVASTLVMSVFDATLWAYERFDLLNSIDVANDILQTAVLIYLVRHGGSLVTVAAVVFAGTILSEIAKAAACFRMDRNLRIGPSHITTSASRELFGFGLWKFIWSIGTRATTQSGPLVVWARLSTDVVTPYSVASRLVGYAKGISTVGIGVVTPTATALHADEQHESQQTLFIEGGKYCLALSLFFVTAIVLFARPFITFWMGPALAGASGAAGILALGEILPMSQWVTYSILLGRDRHRVVACASLIETVVVIVLGLLLARSFGIAGVCLGLAIPGTLGRGVLPIVYCCGVLNVSVQRYFMHALMPPILAITVPAAGMAALLRQRPPNNWLELFCYGGVFGLAYSITSSIIVVGVRQMFAIVQRVRMTVTQLFAGEAVS
ncbi:MAG TPA: oligosaccharide flippase family protein [Tepidisphaeraceae bacterium]|nr:oligosaccharide flippase family protein [Tepidisphaeraceae bacterium]